MYSASSHSPSASSARSPFFLRRRRVRRLSPVTQWPEIVSAVELAYGKVLACDVDVAMKYAAVGVVVAATVPLALTHSRELERLASEGAPAESKVGVALAPKYAGPYGEKSVVEAPPENCWRAVHVLALESN